MFNKKTGMKLRTITVQFSTLKKAEKFQNKLYDQYSHVQLKDFPRFQEEGKYTWEVGNSEEEE